jgi:hypothetical protein
MVEELEEQEARARAVEGELAEWIRTFPSREVKAQIAELESARARLEDALRSLHTQLALWDAARRAASTNGPRGRDVRDRPLPPKREAILHVLSERPDHTFRLAEIREILLARGWMPAGRKAAHALEVAATTLAKRGEIDRPRRGFYRMRGADADRPRVAA